MRSEIKEYQAVQEAAEKFVKSVAEGNSAYAKTLFTEDAVLFGMLDGMLEHGSIEQFYHNVQTKVVSRFHGVMSRGYSYTQR